MEILLRNFAAQELKEHGFELYHYTNMKNGEPDFEVEKNAEIPAILLVCRKVAA